MSVARNEKQNRQSIFNVILKRVRVNIVVVKKQ